MKCQTHLRRLVSLGILSVLSFDPTLVEAEQSPGQNELADLYAAKKDLHDAQINFAKWRLDRINRLYESEQATWLEAETSRAELIKLECLREAAEDLIKLSQVDGLATLKNRDLAGRRAPDVLEHDWATRTRRLAKALEQVRSKVTYASRRLETLQDRLNKLQQLYAASLTNTEVTKDHLEFLIVDSQVKFLKANERHLQQRVDWLQRMADRDEKFWPDSSAAERFVFDETVEGLQREFAARGAKAVLEIELGFQQRYLSKLHEVARAASNRRIASDIRAVEQKIAACRQALQQLDQPEQQSDGPQAFLQFAAGPQPNAHDAIELRAIGVNDRRNVHAGSTSHILNRLNSPFGYDPVHADFFIEIPELRGTHRTRYPNDIFSKSYSSWYAFGIRKTIVGGRFLMESRTQPFGAPWYRPGSPTNYRTFLSPW